MTDYQFQVLQGMLAYLTGFVVLAIGIIGTGTRSWIVIGLGVLLILLGGLHARNAEP